MQKDFRDPRETKRPLRPKKVIIQKNILIKFNLRRNFAQTFLIFELLM